MFLVLPFGATVKVSVVNRVAAKAIDLLLVFILAVILPYPVGPLLGFFYSIFGDGISAGTFEGQSVGKKLMKLRVMSKITKKPAQFRDSALRNTPVGVATFFALIPIWGWLILALVGVPLMVMEVYLMVTQETGFRLGDIMGDTEVIELK